MTTQTQHQQQQQQTNQNKRLLLYTAMTAYTDKIIENHTMLIQNPETFDIFIEQHMKAQQDFVSAIEAIYIDSSASLSIDQ